MSEHVATTYTGLADLLEAEPALWDAPTLCAGWTGRHLVAHVTMPSRLDEAAFGREIAAAGGDFGVLSDRVAERDAALPGEVLLDALRDPVLHAWLPPGGGETGALIHAVVHALDVTVATGRPSMSSSEALTAVRDALTSRDPNVFGVRTAGREPAEHVDVEVALLANRTLVARP